MDILDREKRRARNLIWNAAGEYGFEPEFKAYDREGRADLYWNSIVGTVRKCYGEETVERLFSAIRDCEHQEMYEQLLWLGLENAAYQRESPCRPALPSLRRSYARRTLQLHQRAVSIDGEEDLLRRLETGHLRRALGEDPALMARDREMLDALELPGTLDGPALADRALAVLQDYFQFVPGRKAVRREIPVLSFLGFKRPPAALPAVRAFVSGFGEHTSEEDEQQIGPAVRRMSDRSVAQTAAGLRQYMRDYFGAPLYDERQLAALEDALCVGDHQGCHLYYANGDGGEERLKGYVAAQRKAALRQMERNRAAYEADSVRHRAAVIRLTARIRNAMMAYLQPTAVRSPYGSLDAGRVWRGVYLDDSKVFTRIQNSDPGQLSVDLLLDSSNSQLERQAAVAAQGYMIAESLTRCHIPVRVTSFCSLSGYTVLTRYRDYGEEDRNERIFHYFAAGCNRDGLAIRALGREVAEGPCEHKMVILLSDAKPNDVVKIRGGADYAGDDGVQNTAMEVRSLLYQGIAVICVFTGEDGDLPAAHTIYGRDFARIRSLDQFADTVGNLIQNQLRSL